MNRTKHESLGFSLLETLVALAILSLSLGVIYQAQANSVRSVANNLALQRVLLHGQSLLAEHTGPRPQSVRPQDPTLLAQQDRQPDGTRWQIRRQPVQVPPLLPDAPPIMLAQLEIRLSWGDDAHPRELRVVTWDWP